MNVLLQRKGIHYRRSLPESELSGGLQRASLWHETSDCQNRTAILLAEQTPLIWLGSTFMQNDPGICAWERHLGRCIIRALRREAAMCR